MTRQEYIISDLSNAVIEKEYLAYTSHPNRWEIVSYETEEVNGKLLIASEESWPEPVTINPELTGWYKIYLCMTSFGGGVLKNHIDIKLKDDEFPSTVTAGDIGKHNPVSFSSTEVIEEAFWKCADMTDQTITISKPKIKVNHHANLYWIRFVPMAEDDVAEYHRKQQDTSRKTIFAHMDGDFHMFDNAITPHDFCKPFYAMKDSDVGIVCQEVCNDLIDYSAFDKPYAARDPFTTRRMEYFRHLFENREAIYAEQLDYAHKCGMQLFAGHRMQLSNFAFPFSQPMFTIPFVTEHPELRMQSRTGVIGGFLSYAYPETQDFMIKNLLDSAEFGFDGVLLIFNRGMHLGFEAPVAERYRAKFGDTKDFYRLPQNHPRLLEIHSDIIAEFLGKIRKAFQDYANAHGKAPLKVYLNSYFSYEDALLSGFDLERLAKEGLIDAFIQTKQAVIEDTDDILAEDGLIDLEKYTAKAQKEPIFKRYTGSDVKKLVAGVTKMSEIAKKYNVALFSEIQWETFQVPEAYVKAAHLLFEAGGHHISLWDCYPCRVIGLAEWHGTSQLGNAAHVAEMSKDGAAYHKIIRVHSYNGENMLYGNPSWRG